MCITSIHAADNGNWSNVTFIYKTLSTWFYSLDLEQRTNFDNSHRNQSLITPMLGYILSYRHDVELGYDLYLDNQMNEVEQEPWEQDQYDLIIDGAKTLTLRTRFEQRFSRDNSQMALRLRTQLLWLWKGGINNKYSPVLFEEPFFNINHPSWVSNKTLSQNRLFLGVDFPMTKRADFLLGYQNRVDYNTDNVLHQNILYLSFDYNFGAIVSPQIMLEQQT